MPRPEKKDGEGAKYWRGKYNTLQAQYKKEVIYNDEREKRNKQTRFELMMEIKRLQDCYAIMEENFENLLRLHQPVDKPQTTLIH